MSILWMDGPDHYGTNVALLTEGAYAEATNIVIQQNTGPSGVGATFFFGGQGLTQTLRKVLPGNRSLVAMAGRFFYVNLPTTNGDENNIFSWRDAANNELYTARVLSTGAIQVQQGDNGAVLYTTAPVILAGSWQFIEIKLKLDPANGSLDIGVNSLTIASINGLNTGNTQCAQIAWKHYFTGAHYYLRDIYAWDDQGTDNNSGMQGDRQVLTSFPNADGAPQDWLYSAGAAGWPLISNDPPDDTKYVYANTAGNKSEFDTTDIDTTITSISAMMVVGRAAKSDAGLGTMKLGVVSGASTAEGIEIAISTQFVYYNSIFEHDPATGVKWTPAGVNASKLQLDRVQ